MSVIPILSIEASEPFFDALALALPRLEEVFLWLEDETNTEWRLARALSDPAPCLKTFALSCHPPSDGDWSESLPPGQLPMSLWTNHFAGTAPMLRTLLLREVRIPLVPETTYQFVTSVDYGMYQLGSLIPMHS